MATDRGAVLTIRAAARGVIDFTKADVRNINWWRRTNLLIGAMVDADDQTVLQAAYEYQLALVGNGMVTKETFESAQKTGKTLFNEIVNLAQPWAAKTMDQVQHGEIASLIDTYKRLVGDPADPAFQQRLRETAANLMSVGLEAKTETDDERVSRRLREREALRR